MRIGGGAVTFVMPAAPRHVFLAVAVATAIAAPWRLGSESVAAQWLLLWGAVATLAAGLVVRAMAPARDEELKRGWLLVASLGFGALLLAELAVQVGNPSHAVVPEGTLWRLIPLASHPSLPQSIAGRFHESGDYIPFKNAARYALIFGAVWCYAAGLALGFVERTDARRWAFCMGGNGVVMALVCLAHRALREDLTLWKFRTTFDFTHSPIFFYKNHNGAYLAASLAVVLGLAASQRIGPGRRLWEVGALLLWLATVAVNSRAATAIATLWVLLYLGLRIRMAYSGLRPIGAGSWLRRGGITLAVLAIVGVVLVKAGATGALARFGEVWSAPGEFLQGGKMRALQREVGLEMWRDRPVWGWGGGSFVYLFNTYHARVPELAAQVYRDQPQLNRFFGPTVNCDWIEFLVEYGLVGVTFMLAAAGLLLGAWWRWRGWRDPLSLFSVLGFTGLVLHGYLDYILRNPALLIFGTGALFAALRLAPSLLEYPSRPVANTCIKR